MTRRRSSDCSPPARASRCGTRTGARSSTSPPTGGTTRQRALLAGGADPNALDSRRYDLLTIAAVRDDLEMVRFGLAGGADPRGVTSPYDGTALIAAAHLGHVAVVRELVRAGAPLDHVNNLGWTALLEAIILGDGGSRHAEIVRELVGAGARLDLADREGTTPLAHARRRGYTDMVTILERAGARF